MKKILYTAVCMLLFCSACSDSDIEPNPSRQAKRHVTLTFSPVQISTRTSADETRIDDINLYLFPTSGDTARHLYLSSQRSVVLELPEGDYALYAVANAGADMGGQTQEYVRSLRFEQAPDAPSPASASLPSGAGAARSRPFPCAGICTSTLRSYVPWRRSISAAP